MKIIDLQQEFHKDEIKKEIEVWKDAIKTLVDIDATQDVINIAQHIEKLKLEVQDE